MNYTDEAMIKSCMALKQKKKKEKYFLETQ